MKRLWACSLRRGTEEEKMKYGKAEILVTEYKAAFTVPYFAASLLFLTFGTA